MTCNLLGGIGQFCLFKYKRTTCLNNFQLLYCTFALFVKSGSFDSVIIKILNSKVIHFSVKSFSFQFSSAGFCFLNCPLLSFVWVVAFQSFDKVIHGGFSLSEIPGWLHGLFGGEWLVGLFCILVLLIFFFLFLNVIQT